jgi:hypothetical protein
MITQHGLIALARALEGMPVLGCVEGEQAAAAGIRYGDVLLYVNGRRTRTLADYIEAKQLRRDSMNVVLFRDGREQFIELSFAKRGAPHKAIGALVKLARSMAQRTARSVREPSCSN